MKNILNELKKKNNRGKGNVNIEVINTVISDWIMTNEENVDAIEKMTEQEI